MPAQKRKEVGRRERKRAVEEIKSGSLINILDDAKRKGYHMNLLDEATKKALDAGKIAVLDGGYIILTPETLFRMVQGDTLETLGDIMMEQPAEEEANDSFIQWVCRCHFCGKESDFTEYTVTISGGYDSDHDMETVSMNVCAGCLEKMLAVVS